MADIPELFVQPLEDQPNLSVNVEVDAKEIPVFDISSINVKLISEIHEACKTWGFFQVINHGFDMKLKQKLETVAHDFFQQPLEQKKLIKRDELNPTGFHDSEHTQNVRDWKEVFICFTQDPTEISASHVLEEVGIMSFKQQVTSALKQLQVRTIIGNALRPFTVLNLCFAGKLVKSIGKRYQP